MAYNENLARRIRKVLAKRKGVVEKRCSVAAAQGGKWALDAIQKFVLCPPEYMERITICSR